MGTGDVIGVDLKLRLGQELAVIIQQKRLTDLIAIGFLRAFLDQNFALEHARGPVAQYLLEDLTALTIQRIMGDEHSVIVVKIRAIADTNTGNMGHRIIADDFKHTFVAREYTIEGERE